MEKFVIYYRVSTKRQGESGLGLEAQKRDVSIFLESYAEVPFKIIGEFTDIVSGANSNRPELEKAIAIAKGQKAELLVAKLDRLSRKVSLIAQLAEDKLLKLRIASMPYADKFQIHIYAALAEQEREFISKRTKAALAEAKKRGVKLGGDRGSLRARNEARANKANDRAERVRGIVQPMKEQGHTLQEIAASLSAARVGKARGGTAWTATDVRRVLVRLDRVNAPAGVTELPNL